MTFGIAESLELIVWFHSGVALLTTAGDRGAGVQRLPRVLGSPQEPMKMAAAASRSIYVQGYRQPALGLK